MALAANVLTLATVMGTIFQNTLIPPILQITAQPSVVMVLNATLKNAMMVTKLMAMDVLPNAPSKKPGAALQIRSTLAAPSKILSSVFPSRRFSKCPTKTQSLFSSKSNRTSPF
jgi:hypothetical protein